MTPQYQTDRDLEQSEAYQHGRTQARLESARSALKRILAVADGRAPGRMLMISAIAKLGLQSSATDDETGKRMEKVG